ncbi:aminoglycoside phosphotransferase family protein [Geodermatophilus sp. SYSU D00684]
MCDPGEHEVLAAVARTVPLFVPAAVQRFSARRGKADVYRVDEIGGDGALVLKRDDRRVCAVEERVYRDVLARLPVPAIRCYGTVPSDDPTRAWLVMDHAAGVPFDHDSSVHTTGLARWLGAVHSGAVRVAEPADFPDHGPEYWRDVITEAQLTVQTGVENPAVPKPGRTALVSLAEVLERVLGTWSDAEERMATVPRTLTHGDLVPQNLQMNGDEPGQHPWVHDWGAAGWGCPMIDLLRVNIASYVASLGPDWPPLSPSAARALRALGSVCWTAWVLIEERESLASAWPDRAAAKVPGYLLGLARHGALAGGDAGERS